MTEAPIQTKARVNEILRAACEVLVDHPEGVAAGEVITAVRERVLPTDAELTRNKSGYVRYDTNLRFWSIDLVKAGWVEKSKGRWFLTSEGRAALEQFPDAQGFGQEASRRYREWKAASDQDQRDRETWRLTDAVIARIPPGRWVTFTDLGEAVGRGTSQIGKHLWVDRPPFWYRVLRVGGNLPADYFDPDRADEHRRLLNEEGVDADPVPSDEQRLSPADIRGLVAEVTGAPRAWLVRGSAVDGVNLVPSWMELGFVSLAARQLPPLPEGADDAAIKSAVETGYAHLGYSQRQAKYDEIRAFLRRIRPGHLVLTTSESEVFVGEITGPVEQVESEDRRSNLRRPVSWDNADSPLDTADMSARLLGALRSSAVVLDLTDVFADVEALRPPTGLDAEEEEIAPPAVADARPLISPLPDEVTDRLLVGRGWLDEFVELLAERRQVILYGPPGTGKTFLAQEVAEALAGPERVTLVQFHPAYSYEDFFEGYRPSMGDDGQVGFRLVPGPFRKVVDAAREDPTHPHVLIIDEINRGNLAKVFGELYFLLEYRDRTISLLYSSEETSQFSMPDNVFLIGTMNTADRSIALVDAAMRRRFGFLSLHPDDDHLAGVLPRWLADHDLPANRALLLAELNRRIEDREFRIGPSYLMRESAGTDAGLERIWRTSILPLLEEHHAGDDVDVERRYRLAALRRAVEADRAVEVVPDETVESSAVNAGSPTSATDLPVR